MLQNHYLLGNQGSVTLLAVVLSACAGGQPAQAPTGGATEESATPAAVASDTTAGASDSEGEPSETAAAEPSADKDESNEFKKVDSRTAKDTRGVKESKLEPTKTEALLKFVVVDKDKGPVEGIVISLVGNDGKKYYTKETDAVGYAETLVPVAQNYDIVYLSLGNKDVAAKTPVEDQPNLTLKLTLTHKRFVPRPSSKSAHESFILDGVEFDTGKATIRPGSFSRLDNILEYMTHKPNSRIAISGHTDNVGKKEDNKILSQKRAQACRDYLIKKGIDGSRIEAVGYGDELPIGSNDTPAGRQKNRRIVAGEL